jgi:hypothetical protein
MSGTLIPQSLATLRPDSGPDHCTSVGLSAVRKGKLAPASASPSTTHQVPALSTFTFLRYGAVAALPSRSSVCFPCAKRVYWVSSDKLLPCSFSLIPPDPDLLIRTSTSNSLAVWTPVKRKDLIFMPGQILLELPSPHIPYLERSVFATARQQPAVSGETRHVDGADVGS